MVGRRSNPALGCVTAVELHRLVEARMRERRQRYTTTRRAMVEVLASCPAPVDMHEIVRRDATLALSSAYRGVLFLERANVVHRVAITDGPDRFELAQGLLGQHHHLVCAGCGDIVDVHFDPDFERELRRRVDETAGGHGFRHSGPRLDIRGICAACTAR